MPRCEALALALTIALAFAFACATPAWAQRGAVDGHVSLTADYLPNVDDAIEARARLFVERKIDATPNLRFSLSGWAEALVARRSGDGVSDAVARPHEAYVDLRAGRVDLRAGLSNVVWGRLDEVQPSDVINPLNISSYLFEGRSAARLPVPLVRARWFAGEALAVEGVWVPLFRRTRVDFLDEDSSPFDLLTPSEIGVDVVVDRDEPARTLANSQGGVRVSATSGRVDWSVSAYRGFESFGAVTIDVTLDGDVRIQSLPLHLVERYPRFTMIASDVEAVRGKWTMRGEVAGFVDEMLQSPDGPFVASGHRIEGGGSLERKAGDYRINGEVLVQRRVTDAWSDTDVSLVTGAQRTFARDTRRLSLFGVWNMADATGFLRSIGAWSLRDNLWLEGSVGWFFGEGTDTLSRFGARDFAYVRLKAYF